MINQKTLVRATAEFIGTFVFLSVVLNTAEMGVTSPIGAGIGLMAAVFLVSKFSKAHLNPAATFMSWFNKDTTSGDALVHVAAQLLGGVAAWWISKELNNKL
jgi:glycerol uptake facilitator-like aquaporin